MDIKAVLFDKDGTLIDFEATFTPAVRKVMEQICAGDDHLLQQVANRWRYNFETEALEGDSIIVAGSGYDIAEAVAPLFGVTNIVEFSEMLDSLYGDVCNETVLVLPGIEPALGKLAALEYAMGIATNDSQANAEAQMHVLRLDHHFQAILGADSGYGAKPEPGMIHGFAENIGIQSSNILMVGDSLHDLKAGKSAGAFTCGVVTGPASAEDLNPYADVVLESVEQLPQWLARSV